MIEIDSTGEKVTGFYRGKVVALGENGKCKIFIPGVYPVSFLKDENIYKLPDAEFASSISFDSCFGNGFFTYPAVGSYVWCFFANEDQNFPVYFASCHGSSTESFSEISTEVIKDLSETNTAVVNPDMIRNSVQTNFVKFGNLRLEFCKGDKFDKAGELISSNPSIKISTEHKVKNDSTSAKSAVVEINSNGNISINTTEDISLSGNNVTISAGNTLLLKSDYNTNIVAGTGNVSIASKLGSIVVTATAGFVSILTKWTKDLTGKVIKKII